MSDRAARRRQELVDAAFAAFVEQGYAATSVTDITSRLGVSHGTFYRYFDSKRDILDEVIDAGVERFMTVAAIDEVPPAPETADELLARVGEAVGRVFDLVQADPGLVRLIMLEATSVDEELSLRLMGLMDLFASLAAPYLEQPGVESDVLADALVGMLLPGLVLAFRGTLDDAARERHVRALTDLLAHGLIKK